MTMKIEEIEAMPIEDIRKKFNEKAQSTCEGLSTWQQIYEFKKQDMLNEELTKINNSMLKFTKIVTFLTAINVVVAIITTIVSVISIIK